MKKIGIILILMLIVISGCKKEEEKKTETKKEQTPVISNKNANIDTKGSGKLHCVRNGAADTGVEVSIYYDITYEEGLMGHFHGMEKITTENQDTISEYENAYKEIAKHYKDLDYYTNNVLRDENSVAMETIIDYDKLDLQKLLDIEGEEDNIVTDGKVYLSTWLEFMGRFGTVCEEVKE